MVRLRHVKTSRASSKISLGVLDDEDGLECPVCWEGFDNLENLPYVLWCGHSLCRSCVMGLQWAVVKLPVLPVQLPLFISCPWCQFLSCRLFWRGKLRFPCKNFFLLWMIESVKGGIRQCHDGSRLDGSRECQDGSRADKKVSSGTIRTVKQQNIVERCASLCSHGNADEAISYPNRQFSSLAILSIRTQHGCNEFFLCRWFMKFACACAQLMAKFLLAALAIFILFCVLPFGTVILVLCLFGTFIFAFPSLLVVYFAFPSLGWLLRQIVT